VARHGTAVLEIINFLGNKILGGIVNVGSDSDGFAQRGC
jgi:hypothetical protein